MKLIYAPDASAPFVTETCTLSGHGTTAPICWLVVFEIVNHFAVRSNTNGITVWTCRKVGVCLIDLEGIPSPAKWTLWNVMHKVNHRPPTKRILETNTREAGTYWTNVNGWPRGSKVAYTPQSIAEFALGPQIHYDLVRCIFCVPWSRRWRYKAYSCYKAPSCTGAYVTNFNNNKTCPSFLLRDTFNFVLCSSVDFDIHAWFIFI